MNDKGRKYSPRFVTLKISGWVNDLLVSLNIHDRCGREELVERLIRREFEQRLLANPDKKLKGENDSTNPK